MNGDVTIYVLSQKSKKSDEILKCCPRIYSSELTTLQIYNLMKQNFDHLFKFPFFFQLIYFLPISSKGIEYINDSTKLSPDQKYGLYLKLK